MHRAAVSTIDHLEADAGPHLIGSTVHTTQTSVITNPRTPGFFVAPIDRRADEVIERPLKWRGRFTRQNF
jgi:hypothetical protein